MLFARHPRVEIYWDNVLRGEELLVLVSKVNLPNVQQQYGFLFGCLNCVEPHRRDLGVHVGDHNDVDELLHSRQSRPVRLAAGVMERGVLVNLLWETARRRPLPNCLKPDDCLSQVNKQTLCTGLPSAITTEIVQLFSSKFDVNYLP